MLRWLMGWVERCWVIPVQGVQPYGQLASVVTPGCSWRWPEVDRSTHSTLKYFPLQRQNSSNSKHCGWWGQRVNGAVQTAWRGGDGRLDGRGGGRRGLGTTGQREKLSPSSPHSSTDLSTRCAWSERAEICGELGVALSAWRGLDINQRVRMQGCGRTGTVLRGGYGQGRSDPRVVGSPERRAEALERTEWAMHRPITLEYPWAGEGHRASGRHGGRRTSIRRAGGAGRIRHRAGARKGGGARRRPIAASDRGYERTVPARGRTSGVVRRSRCESSWLRA